LKISVLVTTYARPAYLERCLRSLTAQERAPDEVVVVTRQGDDETRRHLERFCSAYRGPITFRRTEVSEPGVLPANRAGLPLVTGEILCFIDDDAAARSDWIARLERGFADDPGLGAMGGRDLQHTSEGILDEPATVVGRIRWYGRIVGNHHRRLPGRHHVDILKGCNMAFRRSLLTGFDEGIIGNAHYYEMDLCLAVTRAGHRILWDGDLVVDHYTGAPRHLPGNVEPLDPKRYYFMHHNMVYVMLKNLPFIRKNVFLVYTFLSSAAGAVRHRMKGRPEGSADVVAETFRGKMAGFRTYRRLRARAARARGGASA
jgi:GT2 family glycosyltransferase